MRRETHKWKLLEELRKAAAYPDDSARILLPDLQAKKGGDRRWKWEVQGDTVTAMEYYVCALSMSEG